MGENKIVEGGRPKPLMMKLDCCYSLSVEFRSPGACRALLKNTHFIKNVILWPGSAPRRPRELYTRVPQPDTAACVLFWMPCSETFSPGPSAGLAPNRASPCVDLPPAVVISCSRTRTCVHKHNVTPHSPSSSSISNTTTTTNASGSTICSSITAELWGVYFDLSASVEIETCYNEGRCEEYE